VQLVGPADGEAVAERASAAASGRWHVRLDRAVCLLVDVPVAILVLVEIGVLFAGVVARYVFQRPLIWSDELAGILFLWLAMLGAASAFRRSEHMRMTALVSMTGRRWWPVFDALATVGGIVLMAALLQPAWEVMLDESFVTTPALQISNAWRTAAMPVGVAVMILIGLLRVWRSQSLKEAGMAAALMAVVVGVLMLTSPALEALGNANLLIFFVVLFALAVFSGIPIAFAFGMATVGYLAFATSIPITVVIGRLNEGMSHPILLSVPLFIFLGLLIQEVGMAEAMVKFLASFLGHVRGGLQYVLIGAMYLVSGISGSKAADMAAVAPVLFPEMKARGSSPGELVGLLAATGAQTETIPPSLVLIAVGSVTNVSIAALFTGGLLPGAVLGLVLCLIVWRISSTQEISVQERAPAGVILKSFVTALPALALPLIVRSAVIEGVATATEVSTIGIFYSVVVGALVYRKTCWHRLFPMLVETAALSGAILLIIGAASGMAWALTQSGFSSLLAQTMSALPGGRASFLAVSIVAFIILGTVLEGIPAMVLFGPLLFPIARSLGIHEVHYAIVVITAMGIGLFAPPFGVGYYAACAIGRVDPTLGFKPVMRYMAALAIGLVLLAAIPWLTTGFL
jgi:tripartite ATP-independent transporter DctM subunit